MIDINRSEIERYLGYHGNIPDIQVDKKINDCIAQLNMVANPASTYKELSLEYMGNDVLKIGEIEVRSHGLSKNLKGCHRIVLFAATLGTEVDRIIKKASVTKISDAVILQATAAAMIEDYCDIINEEIRIEAKTRKLYLRPRFSPGYGDLDLRHSIDIIRMLEAGKKIGLTVTESGILAPMKSVTAIIGVSKESAHCLIKDCESCSKTDCEYRR